MNNVIGTWVGTEITITPLTKAPAKGKAIRIDASGILIEPAGSSDQHVFYPVTAIMSVTGSVPVKKRKIGGAG